MILNPPEHNRPRTLNEHRSRLPSPIRIHLEHRRRYRSRSQNLGQRVGRDNDPLSSDSDTPEDEETEVGIEDQAENILSEINPPNPIPGIEMAYVHLFKPENFSGEKNTIQVEDFLDTLELSFPCLDSITDAAKKERAKVLALQSHLEGEAKQFWVTLKADKKASFEAASNALKQRFQVQNTGLEEWAEKAQAISNLNNLSQGGLSGEKYVERASRIFAVLGEEYSSVIATKFVDGLLDDTTRIMIDAQVETHMISRTSSRLMQNAPNL